MNILLTTIIATVIMIVPCYPFVQAIGFDEKCKRSDAIIRGVVIDMVTVAREIEDSRGGEEPILEGDWTGPSSVAVIRVISVIKGDSKKIDTIIFVPCGYDFDESPSELTKSKDYILFLESMGRNYFHPLDSFSAYRVQKDIVGMSGLDREGDFDPKNKNRETTPLEEFVRRIKNVTNKEANKPEMATPNQPSD